MNNLFPIDSVINYISNIKVINKKNKIIIKMSYCCNIVQPRCLEDSITPGIIGEWWSILKSEGFGKIKFDVFLNCWFGIPFNKLGTSENGKWNYIKTFFNTFEMTRPFSGIVFVIDKKEYAKYKLLYKNVLYTGNLT